MEDNHDITGKKFFYVTILNAVITALEFLGGIFSGSLSLLSDAVHNLQDTISIVISYIAHVIGKKASNSNKTFGYKRAEILAAFINASVLIAITVLLVIESIKRISEPQEIDGGLMMTVAIIGLIANGISMLVLLKDSKNNLNIKATMLHMLSDTVSSVGVVAAAIFVQLFHWNWVDPLITILVALWIMKESFGVVKETVNILMEAGPKIDLDEVKETIKTIPEIKGVHHAHLWMIDENSINFDAHINVDQSKKVIDIEEIYDKVGSLLKEKYNIGHVTLQVECKKGLEEPMIK
ncbi:cation diffusion facilitator family transporter [Lactobacillus sp. YT155]|uniref:cation diffusion facilitator family transporter n=1 Tax=Lactobacillus sp. YT155 TaxID=3060955 RepID=UPI00265EEF3E|nr:cation diffusion facilitator family transporter [Lactobacillus sp. YT155]MDO1604467.1 cation diffusion facilitator family transporter [Lactobacillus sp. YT155]